MHTYEIINPSDQVTFKAPDDRVAWVCAAIVGEGSYGVQREDGAECPSSLMMFMKEDEVNAAILKVLGKPLNEYLDENGAIVSASLLTFSYNSFSERRTYDSALEAITDEAKRKEFMNKHEDAERTSMNRIVKRAWSLAASIAKAATAKA